MAPAPFFMIRHGETDWNREVRFQGQHDIPINPTGRAQAHNNGVALHALAQERVLDLSGWDYVCTPLSRTQETMERLRMAMGMAPEPYRIDPRIIEVTFGAWETHTLEELTREQPDLIAAREADKWNFVPPNGESYAMAADRVRPFLDDIRKPSVIVAHGGIIRTVRTILEGLDGSIAAKGGIPQDRIYHFDGTNGGWIDPS